MSNLSFRSISALTALKAFIKTGAYKEIANHHVQCGSKDITTDTCKDIVRTSWIIADAMDAEGKKRHASDQRVQEAGR